MKLGSGSRKSGESSVVISQAEKEEPASRIEVSWETAGVCVRDTAPFTMIRPVNNRCDSVTVPEVHFFLRQGYVDNIRRTMQFASALGGCIRSATTSKPSFFADKQLENSRAGLRWCMDAVDEQRVLLSCSQNASGWFGKQYSTLTSRTARRGVMSKSSKNPSPPPP